MGRFYETAQANFVDDFIYQPPWEMAMAALNKSNQDVQMSLDTMELMRNLPVNYWKGVDDERANAVRQEWEGKVNDVSERIKKDLLNPENRAQLAQLKSELSRDMTSGNIYKLQQNAEAYNKFEAARQALKNPADREMYLKAVQMYKDANPDGAYSNIFKPDEMYDSRNVWEEFTNSDAFKSLKPDEQAQSIDNINGAWVVKTASGIETLGQSKIGKAFNSWLGNQTDLKGYANSRQKYNDEQWLDETGNYRTDDSSMVGKMMRDGIDSLTYTKKSYEKGLDVNQVYENAADRAFTASENEKNRRFQRAERVASEAATAAASGGIVPPETIVRTKGLLKASTELQEELRSKFGAAARAYGVTPEKLVEKMLQNKDYYSKKLPNLYRQANEFNSKIQNNKVASKQIMVDLFGQKGAQDLDKKVQEKLTYSTKMNLPLGEGVTGKRYSLSDINKGKFILEGIEVKKGSASFGKDITYVPGSTINKSIVVKPINFIDTKGVSHTVHTYIPFSDFSGTTE